MAGYCRLAEIDHRRLVYVLEKEGDTIKYLPLTSQTTL